MNNFYLSQTEPISSLPRDYLSLLQKAKASRQPVILLRRNRPVAALLDWSLLEKLMGLCYKLEEEEAIKTIAQSEKEFKNGKAKILKSLADL